MVTSTYISHKSYISENWNNFSPDVVIWSAYYSVFEKLKYNLHGLGYLVQLHPGIMWLPTLQWQHWILTYYTRIKTW